VYRNPVSNPALRLFEFPKLAPKGPGFMVFAGANAHPSPCARIGSSTTHFLEKRSMPLTASEVHKMKHAQPSTEGVLPVILERWSPRAFADRDVTHADLKKIFEAARWAPSSFNEQPWRFIVGHRNSETYKKIHGVLVPFNQAWAAGAPVLILGVAKTRFSHNDSPNNYAVHDLGAADGFITLQAASMGIATHQMAGFDQAKAREVFAIPEIYAIGSVMALGYQGDPITLSEHYQGQEQSPRSRKPLSEIVFSSWEHPAELG
jgi:nitroreductase